MSKFRRLLQQLYDRILWFKEAIFLWFSYQSCDISTDEDDRVQRNEAIGLGPSADRTGSGSSGP